MRITGLILALGRAYYALRYLSYDNIGILLEKGALADLNWYKAIFVSHVFFGMIALVAGSLQFFPAIRNNAPVCIEQLVTFISYPLRSVAVPALF